MESCVDYKFNLRKQGKVRLIDTAKLLCQKLLVEINAIFNLFAFNDFKEFLLNIFKSVDIRHLALLLIRFVRLSVRPIQIIKRFQIVHHVSIAIIDLVIALLLSNIQIILFNLLVLIIATAFLLFRAGYFVLWVISVFGGAACLQILFLVNFNPLWRRVFASLNLWSFPATFLIGLFPNDIGRWFLAGIILV